MTFESVAQIHNGDERPMGTGLNMPKGSVQGLSFGFKFNKSSWKEFVAQC